MKNPKLKKYLFVYVTEELHWQIKERCVRERKSVVRFVTDLIEKELKKK